MLSNPPFGVDWKKIETDINNEHKLKGADGRFAPACPESPTVRCCFCCI
ncbi:hypothetical protein O5466_14525 [Escherichia coli]|nr:hypothetical protein [Escherichia coli]